MRRVSHADARLREAAKLGFTGAITPKRKKAVPSGGKTAIVSQEMSRLQELVETLRPD